MKEQLVELIAYAIQKNATDLHFMLQLNQLRVKLRGPDGMEDVRSALVDPKLFHYLKYVANLDLGNGDVPQSGAFSLSIKGRPYFFRFSVISSFQMQTGVLRILNNHKKLTICDLIKEHDQLNAFLNWTRTSAGMVILSGPTGSGKTTTLHALLHEIASTSNRKIMTLEDPVEIIDNRYVQLAINEAAGFTYEEGIRQLMRHDPDVIMIGEIRDPYSAKMAYRCALTGHMVFSTVHARTASEALKRLAELGISHNDLQDTLSGVCAQRLFPHATNRKERVCIYEILQGSQLTEALAGKKLSHHKDIQALVQEAMEAGDIQAQGTVDGWEPAAL